MTEEIGPKKKVLLPKSFPLTPYHKIRFGERLKVYLGGEENVTVQLKNSTYNDTCTLSLVVFFRHGEDETIMYSATRIQICGMLTRNSLSCFCFVHRNNILVAFLLSKFCQKINESRDVVKRSKVQ